MRTKNNMGFCLPKFAADKLRKELKLSPNELRTLDSAQRHQAFSEILGETNAKQVNALFESKLLLKNQQLGLKKWGQQILGMKPEIQRDFLTKVEKMEKILTKEETNVFLEDYIEKKLGVHVSEAEAGKLVDLAKNVERFKEQIPEEFYNLEKDAEIIDAIINNPQILEYGTAWTLFHDYTSSLNPKARDLTFKEFISTPSKYVENTGGIVKSSVASFDNSFWGNQGISILLNPKTTDLWIKSVIKSFGKIQQALRGIDPMIAVKAKAISRPDALNGTFAREKLAIGLFTEEALPTLILEKIPIIGRFFKASNAAYNAAAIELRVGAAERLNRIARRNNVDLTVKANAEAIGHLVNSKTGRGSFGVGDPALKTWNQLMFSPRLLKGTFDVLTAHLFDVKVRTNPFARKQAAYQIMGMVATYYGITTLVEALSPGSTEPDPRGAHFGQIKMGNSWVNIIGPFRPLVRVLGTMIPTFHNGELGFWRQNAKGVWSGIKLFPTKEVKYGTLTPLDMAESFLEGKASPLLSTVMNHWRGRDFLNQLPTPQGDIRNLFTPITIKNWWEDKENENVDSIFRNTVLNAFGFSSSTQIKK